MISYHFVACKDAACAWVGCRHCNTRYCPACGAPLKHLGQANTAEQIAALRPTLQAWRDHRWLEACRRRKWGDAANGVILEYADLQARLAVKEC